MCYLEDNNDLSPNLRSQRVVNQRRIPAITRYILENPESYIFSALTASVDGDIKFVKPNNQEEKSDFGTLWISADSKSGAPKT